MGGFIVIAIPIILALAIYCFMKDSKETKKEVEKVDNGYLTKLVWDDICNEEEIGLSVYNIMFHSSYITITYYCASTLYNKIVKDVPRKYNGVIPVGQNASHYNIQRTLYTNSSLSRDEAFTLANVLTGRLGKKYCVKNAGTDSSLGVSVYINEVPWNSSNW